MGRQYVQRDAGLPDQRTVRRHDHQDAGPRILFPRTARFADFHCDGDVFLHAVVYAVQSVDRNRSGSRLRFFDLFLHHYRGRTHYKDARAGLRSDAVRRRVLRVPAEYVDWRRADRCFRHDRDRGQSPADYLLFLIYFDCFLGQRVGAFDPEKDIAAFCQSDRTAGTGGRVGRRE